MVAAAAEEAVEEEAVAAQEGREMVAALRFQGLAAPLVAPPRGWGLWQPPPRKSSMRRRGQRLAGGSDAG